MSVRVVFADDHPFIRSGVETALFGSEFDIVASVATGAEALAAIAQHDPEIAILDVSMPVLNGLDAMRGIQRVSPRTRTIFLTMYAERPFVLRAMQAGARGYVLKSQAAQEVLRAIRAVLRGAVYLGPDVAALLVEAYRHADGELDDPLTLREREVLQLVGEGRTTKAIAGVLGISFKTAESHRNRIMKKLDIHETAGLVRYAIRRGLLRA